MSSNDEHSSLMKELRQAIEVSYRSKPHCIRRHCIRETAYLVHIKKTKETGNVIHTDFVNLIERRSYKRLRRNLFDKHGNFAPCKKCNNIRIIPAQTSLTCNNLNLIIHVISQSMPTSAYEQLTHLFDIFASVSFANDGPVREVIVTMNQNNSLVNNYKVVVNGTSVYEGPSIQVYFNQECNPICETCAQSSM